MAFVFDIPGKLQSLYGVKPEDFDVQKNNRSKTGSRFWDKDKEGRWYYMPVRLGGVDLWNPVMRVTTRKNIVETHLTERPGSVKEIINREDYVINIKGWIKRKDGQWPETELRQLNDLYQRDESLDIDSVLTTVLLSGQDEKVVIKNFGLPEANGETSVKYELELVTDMEFDLVLEGE